MSLTAAAIDIGERVPWPDPVLRTAVKMLVGRTRRRLQTKDLSGERDFARGMVEYPIAINTREANDQHYELPPEFFSLMLGPQRKYSCCYYDHPATTLAQAEERALAETVDHAALADGQRILELGCGWGSLSLWMARKFPVNAQIVSVSNSAFATCVYCASAPEIEGDLRNLTVLTAADINGFAPTGQFDRVVSVEMFEHDVELAGAEAHCVSWMTPQGVLFIHIFSLHRRAALIVLTRGDRADWRIAQHFFTGGIMPSHGLITAVQRSRRGRTGMVVERGNHYRRTAEHWPQNFDRNAAEIDQVLRTSTATMRRAVVSALAFIPARDVSGLFGHKRRHGMGRQPLPAKSRSVIEDENR